MGRSVNHLVFHRSAFQFVTDSMINDSQDGHRIKAVDTGPGLASSQHLLSYMSCSFKQGCLKFQFHPTALKGLAGLSGAWVDVTRLGVRFNDANSFPVCVSHWHIVWGTYFWPMPIKYILFLEHTCRLIEYRRDRYHHACPTSSHLPSPTFLPVCKLPDQGHLCIDFSLGRLDLLQGPVSDKLWQPLLWKLLSFILITLSTNPSGSILTDICYTFVVPL